MDINQLRHFLAVYDEGSVGKAARHLGITQSALSQSIRRLEDLLEIKLFERTTRGVAPTQFAQALALRARTISLEARGALQDIDELRGLERGNVVVAASPSPCTSIVPEAVKRLLRTRPNLKILVIEGLSDGVISAVSKGEADIGILPEWRTRRDYGLAGEPLMRGMMVVIAGTRHPMARSTELRWQDIIHCSWVLPRQGDVVRQSFEKIIQQSKLQRPVTLIESDSIAFMKNLLASGEFLSFLPRELIIREEKEGVLVPLQLSGWETWERELFIIYRQNEALAPAAKALIKQLHSAARDLAREVGWMGAPGRVRSKPASRR